MAIDANILSDLEIAQIAWDVGFRGNAAIIAISVSLGESGGNAWAINLNSYDPESVSYLSLDKGLCQFNDYWYRDFAGGADAFDPVKSMAKMFEVSKGGLDFTPWNVYVQHKFVHFVERALDAWVLVDKT